MAKTEEEHMAMIRELEDRQVKELEENRARLEESIAQTPKMSSELLNLKKIQENLAKRSEYIEAHKVQVETQVKEQKEMEKFMFERQKKIVTLEANLIKNQSVEM